MACSGRGVLLQRRRDCRECPAPYPAKAVRIVVPYAAGGGTDVQARVIGAKLSDLWGQSVIIDNRPGGGTVLGTEPSSRVHRPMVIRS